MPELPEVEVVRRGLEPYIRGQRIERVIVHDSRSLKRHRGSAEQFSSTLKGRTVADVARRGKFMWITFADASPTGDDSEAHTQALVIHLGMSGQLRVNTEVAREAGQASASGISDAPPAKTSGPEPDPQRHLRITLEFSGGRSVRFIDQRIFGGMHLSPLVETGDHKAAGVGTERALIPESASHIARDVLDPAFDLESFVATVHSRTAPIKSLFLNQSLVSGIGNIYADEALWAARIYYLDPGKSLPKQNIRELVHAVRSVMERALEAGGTSFDALYVNVDGRRGYFARSLAAYGKEGEPCPRCSEPISREAWSNRSSYVCFCCQQPRRKSRK